VVISMLIAITSRRVVVNRIVVRLNGAEVNDMFASSLESYLYIDDCDRTVHDSGSGRV